MTTAERISAAVLSPEQAQRAFRTVMDAFAHPGRPYRLPDVGLPPALLPVAALADLTTTVCVLEDESSWTDAVTTATDGRPSELDDARLVAALRPIAPAELRRAQCGAALHPEDGATVCLAVTALGTGTPLRLEGPGVDGTLTLAVDGLPAEFVAARADAVAGFPAGIDVLLVAPDGTVAGLPRTTTIKED